MDLVFLDTETTGFGQCRLIELGYAYTLPNAGTFEIPEIFSFRVKPPIPIEGQASAVHGIYDEMLALELPLQERPDFGNLKEIFESSLVIAHNGPFDRDVLAREGIFVQYLLDTKKAAKAVYPHAPSHRLQHLREHFGLEIEGAAHSAAGDVAVLIALFRQMQKDLGNLWGEDPEDALARLASLGS